MLSCTMIASMLLFLSIFIVQKKNKKQKAFTAILPSSVLTYVKLLRSTSSVFIAFHPECEHCQYEAKSINKRQKELQNTNIVFFTSASDSLTNVFSHTYGLDTIKNVQVISDKNDEMHQLFDVKTIPSIFIYNKDGQLVKQYKGETKIDAILKAIAP